MKLTVRNLGRIKEAAFDIRPLTVFVGENGTNKTWVAYALYGLMRTWPPSIMGATYELPSTTAAALSRLDAEHETLAAELAATKASAFSIERNFSSYFPDAPLQLELVGTGTFWRDVLRIPGKVANPEIRLSLTQLGVRASPVKVSSMQPGGGLVVTQVGSEVDVVGAEKSGDAQFWRSLLNSAFETWLKPFPGRAFVLPAERKALATAHALLRDLFSEAVSRPVSDYAEFLRRQSILTTHGLSRGGSSARRSGERPPVGGPAMNEQPREAWRTLAELADILEQQVVKGAIGFTSDSGGARLEFRPSEGVELPIHAASSLVRALAGLDLYLKTEAKPGDFLFIDEVEMNAHPEAQLALMEFLAMLVNHGLHVVMTTHSPYIVEHLNNLMAASEVPQEKRAELVPDFRLKSAEAFLSSDKVSAYGFTPLGESIEVTDILDRESKEIDWRTFSRVTDEMTNLYSRILEAKDHE